MKPGKDTPPLPDRLWYKGEEYNFYQLGSQKYFVFWGWKQGDTMVVMLHKDGRDTWVNLDEVIVDADKKNPTPGPPEWGPVSP